jgi:hypothetical protein
MGAKEPVFSLYWMGVNDMIISWRGRLLLVGVMAAAGAGGTLCRGQQVSAVLIEKALDDPAKIVFTDISLEDAFASLSKSLGIKFDVDETAMAQLPYGQLTRLSSVQLQGMTWRDALGELLKPLALTFEPGADRIYILGTEELIRQPRRLNIAELDALVRLQNTNLDNREKGLLPQIRRFTGIDFKLIEMDRLRENADEDTTARVLSSLGQPASKVLNLYSRWVLPQENPLANEAGTWYVRADIQNGRAVSYEIIILSGRELNLQKLERPINISFRDQPVQNILQEMAYLGAIDIRFEPGCFALLDENLRNNFSLMSTRTASIKDALEALSGMTGLAYEIRSDSVYISAGKTLLQQVDQRRRESAQASNPLACIFIVKLPGTSFETIVFLREEELKKAGVLEQYRQFEQKSIADFIRALRNKGSDVPVIKK